MPTAAKKPAPVKKATVVEMPPKQDKKPKPETKPAAQREVITDPILGIEEIDDKYREDLQEFAQMVGEKIMQFQELEAELKGDPKGGIPGLRELLQQMLKEAGVKGVTLPHNEEYLLQTARFSSVNTYLSEQDLLANGVPADVIAKCKRSTPYVTVTARLVKQDKR